MDGALSAEQETEFLHILSVSPEKRALFHSYMGVRSAIKADARGSAVPDHLDRAVLGAAGAAMGGAAAGGAAAGGAAAGGAAAGSAAAGSTTAASGFAAAAGWWTASRVITAVILGLSLFGAGYVLPTLLDDTSAPDTDTESVSVPGGTTDDGTPAGIPAAGDPAASARGERADMNPPETADAGPGSNGTDAAAMTPSAAGSASGRGGDGSDGRATGGDRATGGERIVYRNVYITRVDTVYLSDDDARAGIAETGAGRATSTGGSTDVGAGAGNDVTRVVRRVDTVSIALMQRVPNERPLVIREAPRQEMQFPLPGRFVVEVQREHLNTWPYIDYNRVGAERTQQQFAVSAGYMFDRNHTAGIMAGEKSFAMEYYRIQGDSLYLFQQQPALMYGGGFYRYSLPVTAGIVPEITLQLGGSDLGPVFGGRIGVQLIPFDNVSIILGANGALLAYRYKDKLFTSHSLGLSYGLRYRF